ncbi:Tfp pilus assembly protein PilF [Chitinophaga rupis]|uniref:Tfp pilus assembly protein PilF n=1 Tax=Chitinophaga rupis TaxID=573321 RepID=A0A1H8A917_9BACT|nr:tetratricopeptide repeat protein [Chitinophaga rupis]SEM66318.1 Tfp pilus assembly protein PilF [Chitinophaga rupis]
MAKGIDFEEKALDYLRSLFEQLGFPVIEARQQRTGTQNGFDIRIGFLDDNRSERNFYFECKDYKTEISWNAIAVKIQELHASSHRPDGYIALSPHVNFSNININILNKLSDTIQAPIKYWTPESNVKTYFSLDDVFFESVYGKKPEVKDDNKTSIQEKIRSIIIDMLRQKDKMAEKNTGISFPKELTLKIPRIHQDDIIGRTDELLELHNLLFKNERVVVVNGIGGVGKTTLVQGYLSKYYKSYQHIVWISQLTKNIASDIINAEGLLENLSIVKQDKEVMQLFHEVLSKLRAIPHSPNLLIIDNADETLTALKDLLPGQPDWHVLVTSRELIKEFYPKELDFLSAENAIALFKKHCTHIKQDDQIAELVKVIDFHTLTIEILAKTAQLRRTDIQTLKRAIEEDLQSNVYIKHKGEKIDKVRSYLSSIFNLSRLNEEETWLMKQFSCLPAEFHSYAVLLELIDPGEDKKDRFPEILNRLLEQGWLLYNTETDAYKMHLIVKEVTVRQLLPVEEDVEGLMDKIIGNLRIDQNKDNPVDKFIWIPYGNTMLNNFQNDTGAKISGLQNNLALVLQELGDYAGAKALLEKAVRSDENNFGPDHPTTAVSYSNLALVLKDLGDYTKARALLEKVVRSNENNFGLDHSITAVSYSNLALVLQDLGDYTRARALLEKAIHSAENNFGPDYPTTAVRYSNLATVLQDLGDYTRARALLEKALRSAENNFGPDHPATAVSYSNLALVLRDLGDYTGAQALLEKTVHSDEKNFGPDHPTTAIRYSNLATVLRDLGDYNRARTLLERAMHSAESNFGPDHPTTAVSYSNLALVLKDLGDYTGARALLEKALRSDEKNFGSDHPSTAVRYSNLALILQDLGDYTGARALLERAMHSDEKNFGPDHPSTAVSYSNLALVLRDLGDYTGARVLLEKAMRLDEKNFGSDHPTTAIRYSNLATVLKDLGEATAAVELSGKSLSILKKTLPEGHPNINRVQSIYRAIQAEL